MEITQENMDLLIENLNEHFTRIEQRFQEMGERFDIIDQKFDRIEQRLSYHDTRFNDLEKKLSEKVDKKDFRTLIRMLEERDVINRHEADHFLIPVS